MEAMLGTTFEPGAEMNTPSAIRRVHGLVKPSLSVSGWLVLRLLLLGPRLSHLHARLPVIRVLVTSDAAGYSDLSNVGLVLDDPGSGRAFHEARMVPRGAWLAMVLCE